MWIKNQTKIILLANPYSITKIMIRSLTYLDIMVFCGQEGEPGSPTFMALAVHLRLGDARRHRDIRRSTTHETRTVHTHLYRFMLSPWVRGYSDPGRCSFPRTRDLLPPGPAPSTSERRTSFLRLEVALDQPDPWLPVFLIRLFGLNNVLSLSAVSQCHFMKVGLEI